MVDKVWCAMALALYRRYRPDTFEGVIGQDQVTVPLMRALDSGKLTHAYLFSGPRGCGKTSSARILARCVNCVNGPTSHPCGECESCRDLATGGPGSIDVVEIDAASHNGVDDARELRERAGFAPARDRYKIFILDEAHMVTQQGFNALLKIVEEPPEHVMFIFATTEPEKVIGTIRSRTHHYPFRLVPPEVMGPYLEDICSKEGVGTEAGVLRLAMRAGGGSMRDTLSVLDQLMVGAENGVITLDAAVALLGFTPDALIGEVVDAVIAGDGAKLYEVVQKVVVGGFDPRRFVEDLLARIRDLLVMSIAGDRAESVLGDAAGPGGLDDLRRQATALGLGRLTAIADIVNNALGTMNGSVSPRMRLELLAARLLVASTATVPSASVAMPSDKDRNADQARQTTAPAAPERHDPRPRPDRMASLSAAFRSATDAARSVSAIPDAPALVASPAPSTSSAAPTADAGAVDERWDALVAGLPEDVRRYVGRDRVPRVHLATNPSNGRTYLWIKFDKPISKYAFAMGIASESVDGTNKVQDILRAETRKFFGDQVVLAPTRKMADGQVAPPLGRLSSEERQRIKAQMLQESLGAVPASQSTAAPASGEDRSSGNGRPGGAHSDSETGGGVADDEDPWAVPASQAHVYRDLSVEASHDAARVDDPGRSRTGHVQVPNLDGDDDPWAPAVSSPGSPAAASEVSPVVPAGQPVSPSPAPEAAPMPVAVPEPRPEPQVDPDQDEYSMDDQSLGSAGALDLDELERMFDVRKVEKLAPDDPKNPKVLAAKHHKHES